MARGRILSRSISHDSKFNKLEMREQWFFMRLLPFTDDHGRMNADLEEMHYQIFPAFKDFTPQKARRYLNKLEEVGMLKWKENVVIEFINFSKHQKIGHRKAKSEFPDINGNFDAEEEKEEQKEKVFKQGVGGNYIAYCSKCNKDLYYKTIYETKGKSSCCKAELSPTEITKENKNG